MFHLSNPRDIGSLRSRARPSRLFCALVGLTMLCFAVQSYLVATHIHDLPVASPVVAGLYHHGQPGGQQPLSPEECPLCQAMIHAGSFLSPAAFFAAPVTLHVFMVPVRFVIAVLTPPVSHIWFGRAPPKSL